jgi:sterol 3beta-glucosyltransferase
MGNPAAAEQTTRLVIEALQSAGQRGVLATGWSGMVKADITPTGIYMLESAPHAWLFPRMAAVVHHGGAGTTAAGLRAGAPAVIVPTSNDQFAWGRRLEELGAGVKPIPRKKLSAENLAEAIQCTLRGEMQATTKDLGRKIQSEHGAERAAEIILEAISGIRS